MRSVSKCEVSMNVEELHARAAGIEAPETLGGQGAFHNLYWTRRLCTLCDGKLCLSLRETK